MHLSIVSTVTGKKLLTFSHGGNNFAVVPPEGGGYKLSIAAPYGQYRVEAVVSVDGLDVQDGKPASREKRGYVFSNQMEILGWRVDKTREVAFVFLDAAASYGTQMGRAEGNVGTIGLALYSERHAPIQGGGIMRSRGDISARSGDRLTRSASLSAGPPEVGTGFGGMVDSHVGETTFQRIACIALEVVHYRTRDWLQRAGIPIPLTSDDLGNAFPGDSSFCALPPGYRG